MMTDRRWTIVVAPGVAILVGALLMGCATDKGPAEAALAAAEAAVNSVVAEAGTYAPDQAKRLQSALTALAAVDGRHRGLQGGQPRRRDREGLYREGEGG
jgi:hypothetical protein